MKQGDEGSAWTWQGGAYVVVQENLTVQGAVTCWLPARVWQDFPDGPVVRASTAWGGTVLSLPRQLRCCIPRGMANKRKRKKKRGWHHVKILEGSVNFIPGAVGSPWRLSGWNLYKLPFSGTQTDPGTAQKQAAEPGGGGGLRQPCPPPCCSCPRLLGKTSRLGLRL